MKLKISLILSALFFLQSCDPGVQHDKIIENNSNYDVMFYFFKGTNGGYGYFSDSLLIPKQSLTPVYNHGGIGTMTEFEDCEIWIDSIKAKIPSNDSLSLQRDPNEKNNWKFEVINKTFKNGGECQCRFIFSDADLN